MAEGVGLIERNASLRNVANDWRGILYLVEMFTSIQVEETEGLFIFTASTAVAPEDDGKQ